MIKLTPGLAQCAAKWTHRGWLALCLASVLAACGGSSPVTEPPGYTAALSFVEKGPFIRFSTVKVDELDQNLVPTGKEYTYQVSTDVGTFNPKDKFKNNYLSLTAEGDYYDELKNTVIQNTFAADPVKLTAYADLSSENTVNVNLLTTLTYPRIQTLVTQPGFYFQAARIQAEKEVMAAFHIRNASKFSHFNLLDYKKQNDDDYAMLAISSIFLEAGHAFEAQPKGTLINLKSLIESFQADIKDDGVIETPDIKQAISDASKSVDLDAVATNLSQRYKSLINIPSSFKTASIAQWIDQEGYDIIGKYKFVQSNAQANTLYTSPVYIAGTDDVNGTSKTGIVTIPSAGEVCDGITAAAGSFTVNGVRYTNTSATIHAGDKIAVTVKSGPTASDTVASCIKINSIPVVKFTVVNAPIPIAIVTHLEFAGSPSGLALSSDDKTLYVASMPTLTSFATQKDDGGLYAYDVATDPAIPSQLALYPDPASRSPSTPYSGYTGYYGVALSGNDAYVASAQQEMDVFDVSDPSTPTSIQSTSLDNLAMSILLSPVSSSVYVGTSGSTVLDLKVPTAPASVPINPQPWGLTISPDGSQLLAYSSKTTAADSIDIDISSGTFGTPTPLSSISSLLPDSGVMSAVYYDNEKLFVVGAKGDKLDFATVDTVALDTSSTPLGQGSAVIPAYDGSGIGVALAKPTNITNVSLMACVATMGKVVLIDLTEPANPVVRGSITLPYYLTASKLPLTPSIAVSSDGASIYVSWSGVVYSLHVGS